MVHETAIQWDSRARQRLTASRTKNLPQANRFSALKNFPLAIQMKLVEEIKIAERYIEDERPIREYRDKFTCRCVFFKQYQLPCAHLWQREIMYSVFISKDWEKYSFMFEDCGLEVYETWGLEYVTDIPTAAEEEKTVEERQTLRAREQWERLRSRWFNVFEETATLPSDQRCNARNAWLDGLTHALGHFMRATGREFFASIDPDQRIILRDIALPKGGSQQGSQEWEAHLNWREWIGDDDKEGYLQEQDLTGDPEKDSESDEADSDCYWDSEEARGYCR